MIGLDTNVLVRYLTQDDPQQARQAEAEIEGGHDRDFYISAIVLCELVWVLDGVYEYSRDQIAATLEGILQTARFNFDQKDLLWQSLADYRNGRASFADHLIGRLGHHAGCAQTLTFDRELRGSKFFRVL